ncbi:hypothetical protein BsWGS_24485 [Bradybaena similaris]
MGSSLRGRFRLMAASSQTCCV